MTSDLLSEENVAAILDQLIDSQTFSAESRIPGLKGTVIAGSSYLDAYHTETSFDFKKHGFADARAFHHWLLQRCGAKAFSREHLLVVYYPENTTGELAKHLKWVTIPYYFVFTDNGMHILQSTDHSIADLIREMKALRPLNSISGGEHEKAVQQLNDAIRSLGRRLRLPFAGGAPKKAPTEQQLVKELVTLLLRPDGKTAKALKTITAEAVAAFCRPEADAEDDEDRNIRGLALLQHPTVVHSDWKFSAADLEGYLAELTGQPLPLPLPGPGIHSSALLPYAQQLMNDHGWALFSYDTGGDSYLFFAAYASDAGRVRWLFEQLNLPAEECR